MLTRVSRLTVFAALLMAGCASTLDAEFGNPGSSNTIWAQG